jgi:gamma-D-glutamyl-L-lysine dipeptidyl-peptidase
VHRYLLASVLFGTCLVAQQKDTCPRIIDMIISETRNEICPEKRLDYVTIHCETVDSVVVLKGETTSSVVRDSILARSKRKFAQVRDEMVVLPDPSLGDKKYAVMRVSTGHLRRHPDNDMEMISQGLLGEPVRLLKRSGLFYFCQLSDGYLGWMEASSMHEMNRTEWDAWKKADKIIYLKGVGLIYSEKNFRSYPICDIVAASLVINLKKEGKWISVELPDGRRGFVPGNEVMDYRKFCNLPQPTEKSLVHTARQYTGHPYLWGGNSAKGYDCSGFTKTIYRLHNIQLPRDANMQVKVGTEVAIDSSYSKLKAGDLCFFGPDADRITHVGMYIGDQQVIHSDGLVKINSFNPRAPNYSSYRAKGLRAVRRILPD